MGPLENGIVLWYIHEIIAYYSNNIIGIHSGICPLSLQKIQRQINKQISGQSGEALQTLN